MNKRSLLTVVLTAMVALCCLWSCNEKPRHYQLVQNMADGTQTVEKFDAANDTVALNQYLDRMTKIIVENMADSTAKSPAVESMYVISPDGDTLNTDEELLQKVSQDLPVLKPTEVPVQETPDTATKR